MHSPLDGDCVDENACLQACTKRLLAPQLVPIIMLLFYNENKLNQPSRRICLFFNITALFVRKMTKLAVERIDIRRKWMGTIHKKHIAHGTVSSCFFRLHKRGKICRN
jgi:hypothetical protein